MKATIKSDQVASFGVVLGLLIVFASNGFAGSATWKSSPATGDWNTATNWNITSGSGYPNGPSDVATFATSNKTSVSLSAQTEVNGITFNSGASVFTITVPPPPSNSNVGFNISGVGITNNSGTTQKFVTATDASVSAFSGIEFFNSATAGTSASYAVNGGALIEFHNTSTAGSATFTATGDPVNGFYSKIAFIDSAAAQNGNFTFNGPAELDFGGSSSAGSGTFNLNGNPTTGYDAAMIFGSATPASGNFILNAPADLFFYGPSAGNATFTINAVNDNTFFNFIDFTGSAGNATFTINGGTAANSNASHVLFGKGASAGSATFVATAGNSGGYGGSVRFQRFSDGGTSRIELFGNGTGDYTDAYLQMLGNVTIGSLEGTGSVFPASFRLSVGSNGLSTTFSGLIVDCPASNPTCGSGGSLTKIGKGKLTLNRNSGNTYTGGTTINKGTLIAANNTGSATGSGPVQVNSGTLSGTGVINGAVTVGNGTRTGAILQPGVGMTPGTLTINNSVTFNAPSAFKCTINRSSTPMAGKLKALGVTIGTNVSFTLVETGTTTLTPGTAFIVINNTSANPIFGTFSNLPDGGTITSANGTVYKANYSGGTGNDLTLTVQ